MIHVEINVIVDSAYAREVLVMFFGFLVYRRLEPDPD
jgi:hypothetical protein